MIIPGQYRGRAIQGTVQLGENERSGTLQVFIGMEIRDPTSSELIGEMTTVLYFSEGAAPHSFERLRLLGWNGVDDIGAAMNVYANEVDVRVTAPDQYVDRDGVKKTGSSKLEIITGGGGLMTMARTLDDVTFQARLKLVTGVTGGGGGNNTPKPPF